MRITHKGVLQATMWATKRVCEPQNRNRHPQTKIEPGSSLRAFCELFSKSQSRYASHKPSLREDAKNKEVPVYEDLAYIADGKPILHSILRAAV